MSPARIRRMREQMRSSARSYRECKAKGWHDLAADFLDNAKLFRHLSSPGYRAALSRHVAKYTE